MACRSFQQYRAGYECDIARTEAALIAGPLASWLASSQRRTHSLYRHFRRNRLPFFLSISSSSAEFYLFKPEVTFMSTDDVANATVVTLSAELSLGFETQIQTAAVLSSCWAAIETRISQPKVFTLAWCGLSDNLRKQYFAKSEIIPAFKSRDLEWRANRNTELPRGEEVPETQTVPDRVLWKFF